MQINRMKKKKLKKLKNMLGKSVMHIWKGDGVVQTTTGVLGSYRWCEYGTRGPCFEIEIGDWCSEYYSDYDRLILIGE